MYLLMFGRALVLYNAALAAAAPQGGNPILIVGGQQLAPFCHNDLQQTVLVMPGRDVPFVRGAITPAQVGTMRPSYVNAILIQRAGSLVPGGCNRCRLPRPGLRPFPECRRIVGHFGGCCGNCKWRDHAARCEVQDPGESDGDDSGNDPPYEGPESPDKGPRRGIGEDGRGSRLLEAGSAGNPIEL